MAKTKTRTWDAAEHLKSEADMAAYLEAALEEQDPALFAAALGDVARAKGMTQIAREAGLGRESLYEALSADGNPEFATVMKVIRSLGLKLHASATWARTSLRASAATSVTRRSSSAHCAGSGDPSSTFASTTKMPSSWLAT